MRETAFERPKGHHGAPIERKERQLRPAFRVTTEKIKSPASCCQSANSIAYGYSYGSISNHKMMSTNFSTSLSVIFFQKIFFVDCKIARRNRLAHFVHHVNYKIQVVNGG